ncbi:MAG TPA: undecaprenyldiphospho-muramoylpentapeptide beta-N-acetylglucosaminyltransferase [Candidatus Kapabacteria bacterium]|nr:undecaprenyldiphospho-muramoylpentapeptide beta-N-acetylglucosaminyltransferase [Candidatus Kapabacteria bacterium]
MKRIKILIGAGGTGGHLFPALAVMEKIKEIRPDSEFYFTGREDKIEGNIIPQLGLPFIPINVDGFSGISIQSFTLPIKILNAKRKLGKLIRTANINAVICTGAYISLAPGLAAKTNHIPLFLLESNVNPGKAISLLTRYASKIYTSFPSTINFFEPKIQKLVTYTGNPLRKFFFQDYEKETALSKFGLRAKNKTILVFGGSLGAKSINEAMEAILDNLRELNINVIWQTGNNYELKEKNYDNIRILKFIDNMNLAYAAADLIVSRSGATTIAELAALAKPSILVPLPSASTNEQYLNAKVLADNQAVILLEDKNLKSKLLDTIKLNIFDEDNLNKLSESIKKFATKNAAELVAKNILEYIENNGK